MNVNAVKRMSKLDEEDDGVGVAVEDDRRGLGVAFHFQFLPLVNPSQIAPGPFRDR